MTHYLDQEHHNEKKLIKILIMIVVGLGVSILGVKYIGGLYIFNTIGFDCCDYDSLSNDPHYYTQGQKIMWEHTLSLKAQSDSLKRTVIDMTSKGDIATGSDGIYSMNYTGKDGGKLIYKFPETSTISNGGQEVYLIDGKEYYSDYGFENYPKVLEHYSCVEFPDNLQTHTDIIHHDSRTGSEKWILTVGCEDWEMPPKI